MDSFAFPFGNHQPQLDSSAPAATAPVPHLSPSSSAADLHSVRGDQANTMEVDTAGSVALGEAVHADGEGRMELDGGDALDLSLLPATLTLALPLATANSASARRPSDDYENDLKMEDQASANGGAIIHSPIPVPSSPSSLLSYDEPPPRLSQSQPHSASFTSKRTSVPERSASAAPILAGSWRFPFPTVKQEPNRRIGLPSDEEMESSSEDEQVVPPRLGWQSPRKAQDGFVVEVERRVGGYKGKGREVVKEEEREERVYGTKRKRGQVSYAEPADDVDDLMDPDLSRQSSPLSDIPASRLPSPLPPPSTSAPQGYWLQTAYCTSARVKGAVKCHQCVARQAGHGCSFRNLRSFPLPFDPVLRPPTFVPTIEADEVPILPEEYNEPFGAQQAVRLRTEVARTLLGKGTMGIELEHARKGAVRIKAWLTERTTCDLCLTAIVCGSWICRCCGREVCHECAKEIEQLGRVEEGASERQKRLAICVRGRTPPECKGHTMEDFVRLTRADVVDLERIVEEMEAWVEQFPEEPLLELDDKLLQSYYAPLPGQFVDAAEPGRPYLSIPVQHLDPRSYPDPYAPLPSPPSSSTSLIDPSSPPYEPTALFRALWSRGEPMIVDINDGNRVTLDWTPEYFIEQFGTMSCTIVSNVDATMRPATVREFFETFGRSREGAATSEKIKDWPSTTDFKSAFPALFDDFMSAMPVGSVTRRDGVLNVASHTPINSNPPDLGPKGYFSQISNDQPGGNGSTKLHMDVADAVNVMLWSADTPAGKAGMAAWDLFRAEDSDKIRDFLHELEARQMGNLSLEQIRRANDDPIHVQQTYLDVQLREQLRREKGVVSWRIWQKVGQVVFIPAGCAHQVCNFADCIKIASDFVSIENVERCWKLTEEFRAQTKGTTLWKDDVLQLKTQLLWAWKSCGRLVESVEMPGEVE